MKFLKAAFFASALIAGFATSPAHAFVDPVGGVYIDPDDGLDFQIQSATIRQMINAAGTISGYGVVNNLNGADAAAFCPGCELTFQYGGFNPKNGNLLPSAANPVIYYTGGWVNFYVDTARNASPSNAMLLTSANTGDGQLWLSLVGHPDGNGVTYMNTTFVNSLTGKPSLMMSGGQLDVVGGLARFRTNTNTQDFGSDLSFTMSFTRFIGGSFVDEVGSGNFNGDSVPEPGSIALLGLGLLGLASTRRRKFRKN